MQAIEAVKVIRDFVIMSEEPGERERNLLSSLSAMEDAFLRLQITTKRQTRLNEYFQQWTLNRPKHANKIRFLNV